ncbi:putative polyketide cyclase/dehydrase, START-like domain superfamily [Dioscorea sansibarensis]
MGGDREEGKRNTKWHGSAGGLVCAPIEQVWTVVSQSSRLCDWMPMVEKCTRLSGEEGVAGYVRLVSGFMFPQDDGDRSWIKERLLLMDTASFNYIYRMEASNVGLDGSVNSLQLIDFGDDSTLVKWSFEIDAVEGASEETLIDYLGFLYKSCINRIEGAILKLKKEEQLSKY